MSFFGNMFIRHRVVVNARNGKVHKATCRHAAEAYDVANGKVTKNQLDQLMYSRGWSPCGNCMGDYDKY